MAQINQALSMTRESKSAATIRRKRQPPVNREGFIGGHSKVFSEDAFDSGEEDPEFPSDETILGPPVIRKIVASEKTLFLGLLSFRCINALMIQTSYVPDEYWQSIEVAHKMAFGYGHLTWEWQTGLRGYSYPAMFAGVFKLLSLLHLDNRVLLIKLPRLIQGFLAALNDMYLFKLSRKLSGQQVAQWSLFCQMTSWFTFYCITRTLTNSMETVLTTIALYYFPWPGRPRKAHWKYLSLVGLAVVIRPTAAIVWIPLCAWHFWMYRSVICRIIKLFAEIGIMILTLSSIVDRVFYGKWVYVHYNFVQFNVMSGLGSFYGSHPWHWYLSQGFPVIMGSHLFAFIMAARKTVDKALLVTVVWMIFIYSLLPHKEFRFLLPILPMVMHICGRYLYSITVPVMDERAGQATGRGRFLVVFLIVTNLPLALYTSLLHQRGTVDVTKYLHDESVQQPNTTVMFLMPCHSTPYYSYIHRNISMRFLTCEPNLSKQIDYVDEADVFFNDPIKWLQTEYQGNISSMPSHLVMFNTLHDQINSHLDQYEYEQCAKFFHTHVLDGRVGTHVIVSCQRKKVKNIKYKRFKNSATHDLEVTLDDLLTT